MYPQQTGLNNKTTETGTAYEEIFATPAGGTEPIIVHRPTSIGETIPCKILVHFHGFGNSSTEDGERMAGTHKGVYTPSLNIRNLALDQGYIVLSVTCGAKWGNLTQRNAVARAYDWCKALWTGIEQADFIGESMGGGVALSMALDGRIPGVRSIVGISPSLNLDATILNNSMDNSLRAAYGIAADEHDYEEKTSTSGPGGGNANMSDRSPSEFAGLRALLFVSTGDGSCDPNDHAYHFQASCGSGFASFSINQVTTGGHLSKTQYQPTNVFAFLNS